jgi:predicted nucleic acid-binding protein
MTLFVDTSVWSLALRRDAAPDLPETAALRTALSGDALVVTTGIVLQELMQGAVRDSSRRLIAERFRAIALVRPDRADHIAAADLRNHCRANGVQLGTIAALLAALCIRRELTLLSTDRDFANASRHSDLRLWSSPTST